MTLQISTLSNGMRVVTDHVPEMHSVAMGVWCDVGTRYEDLKLNGIAHLVEHMMFKGTKKRNAMDIASEIESVGGQMNAYTSREHTAYYIHLLKDDMPLALDLLADIMQNHQFPQDELEKERHVILQEIGMTNDTPDDLIFDLYQQTAYPDQSVGAPILGTSEIVAAMPHDALAKYTAAFYTPKNIILSAAGYVDHDDFVKRAEAAFSSMTSDTNPTPAPQPLYKGGETRLEKDLEQAHIVLGFEGIARTSDNYEAALLLSTILGGGMSSRLFQEIREKRGLVYSVYSHHSVLRDSGQFEIYAGTGPESLKELIPVICTELHKIRDEPVTNDELARAKAQIRAALLMGRESMLSRADRQAKYLLNFGKLPDTEKIIERIDNVTAPTIQTLAVNIFSAVPTLAALGPLKDLKNFTNIKSLI